MKRSDVPLRLLERYILKELPQKKMRELDKLVSGNPELKRKIDELARDNEIILRQYPPEKTVPEISRRFMKEKNSPRSEKSAVSIKKVLYLPAAMLTAALLFWVILPVIRQSTDAPVFRSETTRIKGTGAALFLYRLKDSRIELLGNNSTARQHDLIQIGYLSEESHGMIFSVDGRGALTLHLPEKGSSAKLTVNRKVLLKKSYELDDAPLFEKFYLVTSGKALNADSVLARAKTRAAKAKGDILSREDLGLGTAARIVTLTIIKERGL